MAEIRNRSIGLLVDDLVTTSLKLWHYQDKIEEANPTNDEIADIFKKIQTLNVRRNAIINCLDELLDPESFSTTKKTYK